MIRKTSINSYNQIIASGVLGPRRQAIYATLYKKGPLTANQIFRFIYGSTTIAQANIHARLNELVKTECVEIIGETHCQTTGMTVSLFDVTEKLPRKLDKLKEPTKKELIKALCEHLDRAMHGALIFDEEAWEAKTRSLLKQCERYTK